MLRLNIMIFMVKGLQKKFDLLVISSAVLCLIHCLFFPVIFLIPLGNSHNHWIDLLFVVIGIYAVANVTKNHRFHWISLLLWSGIFLIASSVIISFWTHQHYDWMYVGVCLLIAGHLLHYKKSH